MQSACPDPRSRSSGSLPETLARNGVGCASGCRIENSVATVGREPELERLDAALDGLATRRSCVRDGGGRARDRQDAPARPASGAVRRSAASSCSRARRRSSSATFRSASGSTRSTPTSPPRSSGSTTPGAPSTWTSWPRSFRRVRPRGDGKRGSVADERYRAHRAVRGLLELLARERPLVLVLDDLHWSDDASIELLAALLRREPDAPVLLALGFRPAARRRRRLSAALAVPSAQRIVLEPLDEAQANAAARRPRAARGRGDLSPRRREPVLPRAAQARARGRATSAAIDGAGVDAAVAGVARARRRRGIARRRSSHRCRRRS